jgi:hypothetical protein
MKGEKPAPERAGSRSLTTETSIANDRWRANFERMAQRAARDPGFYAIAGSGVQCRADEIRRWSA